MVLDVGMTKSKFIGNVILDNILPFLTCSHFENILKLVTTALTITVTTTSIATASAATNSGATASPTTQ